MVERVFSQVLPAKFKLGLPSSLVPDAQKEQLRVKLLDAIKEGDLAPFYHAVCAELGWSKDVALVVAMEANNAKKVA